MNYKGFFGSGYLKVFYLFSIIFVFAFATAQQDSLTEYCLGQGFEGADSDCVSGILTSGDSDLIKLVDFNEIDNSILGNVSNLILNDQSLLNKYSSEVLGGNVGLIKGTGSYDNVRIGNDGIISFKNGEYNLGAFPKDTKITINSDGIVADFKDGAEIKDLSNIGEGEFQIKEGKINLNGESIEIKNGNLVVNSGEVFVPKRVSVEFLDRDGILLKNNADDLIHLSIGEESQLENSVSFFEKEGIKNLLAKTNENGEYYLDFKNGKDFVLGGNGNKGVEHLFRDLDFGTRTLKVGSKGEDVKELQRALGLKDDGIFGPNTKEVVMQFQKEHGLSADGVVGTNTRAKLKEVFGDYSIVEVNGKSVSFFRDLDGDYASVVYGENGEIASIGKSQSAFVVDNVVFDASNKVSSKVIVEGSAEARVKLPEGMDEKYSVVSERIEKYESIIKENSKKVGDCFTRALITQESAGLPDRTDGLGSYGLTQISRGASVDVGLGENFDNLKYDPNYNVKVGIKYYEHLLGVFGDKRLALAAYNWGRGNVAEACKGKIWETCVGIPGSVRVYVRSIDAYEDYCLGLNEWDGF